MQRPYIFCHMLTSLDGKIMGKYLETSVGEKAAEEFYNIAFSKDAHYKHQGWLSGRITTDDNFTFYNKPTLDNDAQTVEAGDYIYKNDANMYYISIDPSGKLGWTSNEVVYEQTKALVVEVLTDKASNAYKSFLRKLNISYIIAGNDSLNYNLLVEKLSRLFNIQVLMLGGGGVLNWSFIKAGLCDEISLVIAPVADGATHTPSLFETASISSDAPTEFLLNSVKTLEGGSMWLRYSVKI